MSITTIKPAAMAAVLLLSFAAARAEPPSPAAGRWITANGNLEVEIAPCGDAWCGIITRVLANGSMSGPGTPMQNAPSPLGKRLLADLRPLADGGWQGHIVNRENGKTYNSRLALLDSERLQLTIYQDVPGDGQVQVWRRAGQ